MAPIQTAGPDQGWSELIATFGTPMSLLDGAVFLAGPDGRIGWVNEAFAERTGYDPAHCQGRLRSELVHGPYTRTEDYRRLCADLAAARQIDVEFVTRTRQGRPYWVELQVRPVVRDGQVVAQVGLERDVTARRQAEERARLALVRAESLTLALHHEKQLLTGVLGTIPHVVWWKNADLRYLGANPAYLALRGVGSPADVVGRLEGQVDSHDDLGPRLALLERTVLESGAAVTETSVAVTHDDGAPLTFLVSVLPTVEAGEVTGVIGVGTDITRVSALERQLAQASRLESIGQLAAGIAHEINTPVQYVSDNTRFVADTVEALLEGTRRLVELAAPAVCGDVEPVDSDGVLAQIRTVLAGLDLDFAAEEVPSALAQSLEGLERVARIVRAMKDFSHPGSARADTDLNRVVESTVQVSRNEWRYVAELDLDLDAAVGLVPCMEGEVKQVVLNIVVNAAQAVAERRRREGTTAPGRLRVSTARREHEALIVVCDDGVGMDAATLRRVFDPFFTTKDVGQGTGQGLSLAHTSVVTRHGGRIEVESVPGQGTTFTVALPLVVPPHIQALEDGT